MLVLSARTQSPYPDQQSRNKNTTYACLRTPADSPRLDWTHKYPAIPKAVAALDARRAYLDGELCGVGPDGNTSFSIVQLASDSRNAAALVFLLFDLLRLDG